MRLYTIKHVGKDSLKIKTLQLILIDNSNPLEFEELFETWQI